MSETVYIETSVIGYLTARSTKNLIIAGNAEVPTKELEAIRERAIRSGFDFIDFWAIDSITVEVEV